MKVPGRKLKKIISKNLAKRKRRLPDRIEVILEDFLHRIDTSKEYELFDLMVMVLSRSIDERLVAAVGDLISCVSWEDLEPIDNDTLHVLGLFIKNGANERIYSSIYYP